MGGEDGHLTLHPLAEEEDTDVKARTEGSYASYIQVVPGSCAIEILREGPGS